MRLRSIGLVLFFTGLFINNYGFLHDVIWAKHDGAIFMGLRSYLMVILGAVLAIGGMLLGWRAPKS